MRVSAITENPPVKNDLRFIISVHETWRFHSVASSSDSGFYLLFVSSLLHARGGLFLFMYTVQKNADSREYDDRNSQVFFMVFSVSGWKVAALGLWPKRNLTRTPCLILGRLGPDPGANSN